VKLTSLTMTNFGNHEATHIDFAPLTVICGKNDQGKSTVAEAIQWALTGRARGIDGRGAGADDLIRIGADAAGVMLASDVDGNGVQTLRAKVRGKAVKVAGAPVTDPDIIQAVLDSPHFLRLPQARQAEILATAGRVQMTVAEIAAEAEAAGLEADAVEMIRAGLTKRIGAAEIVPSVVVADLYKSAYEQRRSAKAELKALVDTSVGATLGPTPTQEEVGALELALDGRILAAKSAAEGVAIRKAALSQIETAQRELASLRAQLAQLPPAPSQGELIPSDDRLASLRTAVEQAASAEQKWQEQLAAHVSAHQEAVRLEAGMRGQIAQAEQGSGTCDGTIAAGKACPLAPKPDETAMSTLRQQLSALQLELSKAGNAERSSRTHWQQASQQLTQAKRLLQEAEVAAAKSGGQAEARREELLASIGRLEARVAQQPEIEESLAEWYRTETETRGHAAAAQERLSDAKRRYEQGRKHQETLGQIEALRAEVGLLEEIVPELEPRGIQSRILGGKLAPFVGQVNALLAQLSPYRIAVQVESGIEVQVVRPDLASPLSPARLATSAQQRLGVAIGAAISIASGLRFLVVDEVDRLLTDLRVDLMTALTDPGLGLETVVLVMSREDAWQPEEAGEAGYWIEGGVANALTPDQVAP
jgi:chromosome segregation protein